MQLPADFQTVETRCGREGHTRPRGPSESPDGVDPNIRRTRKTQRDGHNSGVKIWSLCSVSSTLSHANLEQPFRNPCKKVRGKYIVKEVFLRFPSCFLSSCVFLCASVFTIIESLWYGKWVYNNFTHCWGENNWIHTFPKGISAMWNAISLVQDLNSCRRVHFLRR